MILKKTAVRPAILIGIIAVTVTFLARNPYAPFPIPSTMSGILSTGPHEISLVQNITTASVYPHKPGQMLVKMAYAPVNPSDVYHAFRDNYKSKNKPYPYFNGFEGSGTVVASGGGLIPFLYTFFNLKVAIVSKEGSTWSEYVLLDDVSTVFPLFLAFPFWRSQSTNVLLQGSAAFVNPLTALGFLETAREMKEISFIHTAANSALGKMLIRAASTYGIQVIAVVRGDHNERELIKDLNHDPELLVRSDSETFEKDLLDICRKKGTRLVFDAIAGSFTHRLGQIMEECVNLQGNKMKSPLIYVYGNLSGEFNDSMKTYPYWLLSSWIMEPGHAGRRIRKLSWGMMQMLNKELATVFKYDVELNDPKTIEVLMQYESYQKGGKIVLKIDDE